MKIVIIRQDEPGSQVFFIQKGECAVIKRLDLTVTIRCKVCSFKLFSTNDYQTEKIVKFVEVARLKSREYFGELALLQPEEDIIKSPTSGLYKEIKMEEIKDVKVQQTTVYTTMNTELLSLTNSDFQKYVTNPALQRMREYAKGYPKESEIRRLFWRKKRWSTFKQQLVKEIVEQNTFIRKSLLDNIQSDMEEQNI